MVRFFKSKIKSFFLILLIIILIGFIIPQKFLMPVEGANSKSYHPNSYWYYPWGKSITHKGVDIFAKKGTSVNSSTMGMVVYKGHLSRGGNVVLIVGPKWRFHYYAHLNETNTSLFSFISIGENIGTVGTSGNAKDKPPHLHYAIVTLFPYVWRMDNSIQGWKKMFYLNPIDYLKDIKQDLK